MLIEVIEHKMKNTLREAFNYLFEQKMISKDDLNLFLITDDVDQAFEFVSCILKDKCVDNPQAII